MTDIETSSLGNRNSNLGLLSVSSEGKQNGSSNGGFSKMDIDRLLDQQLDEDIMCELDVTVSDALPNQSVDEILIEEDNVDVMSQMLDVPSPVLIGASDAVDNEGSEDCASSVHTATTRSGHNKSHDWKRPARVSPVSSLLHVERMRAISTQVSSASERSGAGTATCLAVNNAVTMQHDAKRLLAVGCSHSTVLVFDAHRHNLLFSLSGNDSSSSDLGAVSSMAFNPSGSRLAVGLSSGHLLLANMNKRKWILKLRPDECHQPGRGILQVSFAWHDSCLLVLDTAGNVFAVTISSGITGLSHRLSCIFSGCHGEVCAMEPLWLRCAPGSNVPLQYKPYAQAALVALCSLTKAMVVKLSDGESVFAVELPRDSARSYEWPPITRWQWLPIQVTPDVRVIDPVLCVCRQSSVHLYQLHSSDGITWRSFRLSSIDFEQSLLTLHWINTRCMMGLDANERVHVFEADDPNYSSTGNRVSSQDRRRRNALRDSVSLSEANLVYGTADFKGLSTGGAVSEAMSCLADRVCYQAVVNNAQGTSYLLGTNGVYSLSIRSWIERIDVMLNQHQYLNALHLAVAFYTGRVSAAIAAINQSGTNKRMTTESWRYLIADKVVYLVDLVVEDAMRQQRALGSSDAYGVQCIWKSCIPACIDGCIVVNQRQLLYNQIYEKLQTSKIAKALFLECLEDRLLDGKLPDIPPQIIQDYLNYLADESLFNSVESSIVRLPIESLDLHQVVTLCRKHSLWDGIIFVNNRALRDFVTPLKEMCVLLSQVLHEQQLLTDENILLGNKTLFYISCCLCGRAYPIGSLEADDAYVVSRDVFHFIVAPRDSGFAGDVKYPHLRLLLRFDCREFLNVCIMGFECELFAVQPNGQQMVNEFLPILHEVMLDCQHEEWNMLHYSAYLTFLSRLLTSHAHVRIDVTPSSFMKLLKHALDVPDQVEGVEPRLAGSSALELEQSLIELMALPALNQLIDSQQLTQLAERAQLLNVCEQLYWSSRSFGRLVSCCLRKSQRQDDTTVFDLIHLIVSSHKLNATEMDSVVEAFVHSLQEFVTLDASLCASFLLDQCQSRLGSLLDRINGVTPVLRCQVLAAMFDQRRNAGYDSLTGDVKLDELYLLALIQVLAEEDRSGHIVDLCHKWAHLLESSSSLADECLEVCRKHEQVTAVVHLLQATGKCEQAFQYVFQVMKRHLDSGVSEQTLPAFADLVRLSLTFLNPRQPLKKNHSIKSIDADQEESEQNWEQLLNLVLSVPSQLLRQSNVMRAVLSDCVHALVAFVRADKVLDVLFGHTAFTECTYSQHRALLTGIIVAYEYDQVLLSAVVRSMQAECFDLLDRGVTTQQRALAVTSSVCCECGRVIDACQGNVQMYRHTQVFRCGHVCHVSCLPASRGRNECPVHHPSHEQTTRARSGSGRARSSVSAAFGEESDGLSVRVANTSHNMFTKATLHLSSTSASSTGSTSNACLFGSDAFPLRTAPAKRII